MHAKCTIWNVVPYLSSHPSYVELLLLYAKYCTNACLYRWLCFYRLIFISGCAFIIFIGNTRVFSQQLWLWEYLVSSMWSCYYICYMYSTCVCMYIYRWWHFYNLSNIHSHYVHVREAVTTIYVLCTILVHAWTSGCAFMIFIGNRVFWRATAHSFNSCECCYIWLWGRPYLVSSDNFLSGMPCVCMYHVLWPYQPLCSEYQLTNFTTHRNTVLLRVLKAVL